MMLFILNGKMLGIDGMLKLTCHLGDNLTKYSLLLLYLLCILDGNAEVEVNLVDLLPGYTVFSVRAENQYGIGPEMQTYFLNH